MTRQADIGSRPKARRSLRRTQMLALAIGGCAYVGLAVSALLFPAHIFGLCWFWIGVGAVCLGILDFRDRSALRTERNQRNQGREDIPGHSH